MKKTLLSVLVILSVSLTYAQSSKTKPATKPAAPVCKNQYDSASYAVGMSVANYYKKSGLTNLNADLVSKAISDILGGKPGVLDQATASMVFNKYINAQNTEKSKVNISAGEKLLAQNKIKPG